MSARRRILRNMERNGLVRRVYCETRSFKTLVKFLGKFPMARVNIPNDNRIYKRAVAWVSYK